jgi:hypothetical protein
MSGRATNTDDGENPNRPTVQILCTFPDGKPAVIATASYEGVVEVTLANRATEPVAVLKAGAEGPELLMWWRQGKSGIKLAFDEDGDPFVRMVDGESTAILDIDALSHQADVMDERLTALLTILKEQGVVTAQALRSARARVRAETDQALALLKNDKEYVARRLLVQKALAAEDKGNQSAYDECRKALGLSKHEFELVINFERRFAEGEDFLWDDEVS